MGSRPRRVGVGAEKDHEGPVLLASLLGARFKAAESCGVQL